MRSLFLLLLLAALAAGDSAIPVSGTLDLVIPHGTSTSLGNGHRVGLTVLTDGVVTDQVVVSPAVRWDDRLHGLRVEVPPTPLRLGPRSQLQVDWAVEVTGNGKGPWQGGRMSGVTIARVGSGAVLKAKAFPIRLEAARADPPMVIQPVPVAAKAVSIPVAGGPAVRCLVLSAAQPASASRPGLIVALGMGSGDEGTCRYGLGLWWSGAPRAGWTVASPITRGERRWADVPAAESGAVIDGLVAALGCDPARIVVAGASNGGSGALAWLRDHPGRVRAALAFPGSLPAAPGALVGAPVWMRWGQLDDQEWRSAGTRTAGWLTAAGATVDALELPGEDHIPSVTGPEMLAWITARVR